MTSVVPLSTSRNILTCPVPSGMPGLFSAQRYLWSLEFVYLYSIGMGRREPGSNGVSLLCNRRGDEKKSTRQQSAMRR